MFDFLCLKIAWTEGNIFLLIMGDVLSEGRQAAKKRQADFHFDGLVQALRCCNHEYFFLRAES